MNTPDLVDGLKESAILGQQLAAWPDWPVARLLTLLTQRHQSLVSDELVRANSGYGNQEEFVTCVAGTDQYPLPDRSVGNTLRMLEYQVPGQLVWLPLERVDISDSRYYDRGPTTVNIPQTFAVKDGWVELYPSPNAAYTLRMTFFIRPSAIVSAQSTTLVADGSDAAIRGLITIVAGRVLTVAVLPNDQLALPSATAITNASLLDVIHPAGNFNIAAYSLPVVITGSGPFTLTIGGTKDLTKVRVGDYVRAAEQADWPVNLPPEFHRMLADRAAMEVLSKTGRGPMAADLGLNVAADLNRFREVIRPQVKNAPVKIPIIPMYARGRSRWNGWSSNT